MTEAPIAAVSLPRLVLRGLCLVAGFVSAFFFATDLLTMGSLLENEIPVGKVVADAGPDKGGRRYRLESGQVVSVSNWVLDRSPAPVKIAVGDVIEKRGGSFEYVVNGTAVTDDAWAVRDVLLPPRTRVTLGAYLVLGVVFVLIYGRTPVGDATWRDDEPDRPRRPWTRAGLLAALVGSWLLIFAGMLLVFGCLFSCLAGVGKAVFR